MANESRATTFFIEAYKNILAGFAELGYDIEGDENFHGTAERSAKAMSQMVLDKNEAAATIEHMLSRTFPAKYSDMVVSKHNVAFGLCPHHLLPVIYRISLAYIPEEKVLGISKLSRIANIMARRPFLQEDLTNDLAHLLFRDLASKGAAAYIEGLHLCMAARGAEAHEARVVTSAVRGVFLEQPSTRQEFLDLVTSSHPTLL